MTRTSASAVYCTAVPALGTGRPMAVGSVPDAASVSRGYGVVPTGNDTVNRRRPGASRQATSTNRGIWRDGITTMRVRQLMGEPNYLSGAALARILGLSKSSAIGKLNGDISWMLPDIACLSRYFHVSSDWLLGLSNDPHPSAAKGVVAPA